MSSEAQRREERKLGETIDRIQQNRNPAVAAVIDQHTGRVLSYHSGAAARFEASQAEQSFKAAPKYVGKTSVITGEAAKKAIRDGRV